MRFSAKNLRELCFAVVLTASLAGAACAQQITVEVYNNAALSPGTLKRGEAEAGRILAIAGIQIVWLNCADSSAVGERCLSPHEPNVFVLQVVPEGRTSTDSVFGEAFLGEGGTGKYCDIFFQRIRDKTRESDISVTELLGAVAAHELGHLLLGSHAHSRIGIMEPIWEKESLRAIRMGTFLFTPDQAAAIKARVAKPAAFAARVRPEP
jgi:hypothetical protein